LWGGRVPDLRQLRTFIAVAEELNFTRAAARLHLAQQAVSKAVRRLERELGVELLERTTREVRLTAAGAELLDAGRGVLAAADDAFARTRAVGRGLAGTIRVGVSPALGPSVLDEVTAVLRADAPAVAVALLEVRPGDIERLLRDRALDMVLARTARAGPEVESAALRPTPAVVAVAADHRLAGAAELTLAELDGERLLTWIALLPVRDDLTLPLLLLWPAGAPSPAVRRVREGMSSGPTPAQSRSLAGSS
jgi:DNA-binding transcriptional LysR family regulator